MRFTCKDTGSDGVPFWKTSLSRLPEGSFSIRNTWHGVLAIGRVEELHLLRLDEFLHQVDAWGRELIAMLDVWDKVGT